MQLPHVPLGLALGLALTASASAQFTSARPLIPKTDSHPIPGLPHDGIWTRQFFHGDADKFITPVDGGYLGQITHHRVVWLEESRTYSSFDGGGRYRVLPLSTDRTLFESDHTFGGTTWALLGQWAGEEVLLYELDVEPGSRFVRHLTQHDVQVRSKDEARVVDGRRGQVLEALRTWPLERRDLSRRLRRPKHEEMARVWNWFEVQRWVAEQRDVVRQVERAESSLQALGSLHAAHRAVSEAYYPDLANLDAITSVHFEFGQLGKSDFEQLAERAKALRERIEARIAKRMEWLTTKIEVVSHEKWVDPDGWPTHGARPGQALEFHIVVKRADGTVLGSTREKDEPSQAMVMGDLPEGIQYGLCTMGWKDEIALRIPGPLAFGDPPGEVIVELQIVRGIGTPSSRPPLEGLLGYEIAPIEAQESPSGLRYLDLSPGEGEPPARGSEIEVRLKSWNAAGRELDEHRSLITVLGSDALLPGVNEGLASMKPGSQRLLYVPRHLADSRPERRGMAQCVVVELVRVLP